MEDMDFIKVKEAYNNLITEYVRLLNHVNKRRTNKILRAQVESHIRGKLQELSQSFAILMIAPDRITDEFSDWLKLASDDCDRLAGKLISMREFLAPLFKFLSALIIFVASLIFLSAYKKPTSLSEVLVNVGPFLEFMNNMLDWIAYGGMFILGAVIVTGVLLFAFIFWRRFLQKRALFGDQYYSKNRNDSKNQDQIKSVYSLENELFEKLNREKVPEFPLTRVFTFFGYYFIIYLISAIIIFSLSRNLVFLIILTIGFIPMFSNIFSKEFQEIER